MPKNLPLQTLKSFYNIKRRKEKILEILDKKKMNVSKASEAVGISRTTFYKYLQKDEEFKRKVSELQEKRIDYVEDKLMTLVKKEVPAAVFFFLKCQAKSRGYIERQEINIEGTINHYHQIEENLSRLDDGQLTDILTIIEGESKEIKELNKIVDNDKKE